VNGADEVALPPFVVTLIFPVVAPLGTVAVICVAEFTVKVAFTCERLATPRVLGIGPLVNHCIFRLRPELPIYMPSYLVKAPNPTLTNLWYLQSSRIDPLIVETFLAPKVRLMFIPLDDTEVSTSATDRSLEESVGLCVPDEAFQSHCRERTQGHWGDPVAWPCSIRRFRQSYWCH
jgi:hypothetical protein